MPTATPNLSRTEARDMIAARGFDRPPTAPSPGRQVGIELEWLTVDADDPARPAPPDTVHAAATAIGPFPESSRLTFEPGGQVELSSPPLALEVSCEAVARDAAVLGDALAGAGVGLVSLGLEPGPQRDRVLRTPRYDAMETYFDSCGPSGRTMMRSTAALQVNLDLGSGPEIEERWHAAHDVGPVLAAAFANSPIGDAGPTGYRSTRLAVWSGVDRSRTTAVDDGNGARCSGFRDVWADYALAAPVMLVRTSEETYEPLVTPLTFGDWVGNGHELGWPTLDDLDYHLTTLFPPIRPKGWLELRMLDAVPAPWWRVAAAVSAVLVQDADAADAVRDALTPVRNCWDAAARCGLADPALAAAARTCFATALEALPTAEVDPTTLDATREFVDRYVTRGRCPADDRLDDWRAGRPPFPAADNRARDAASARR
ncbi:MAG: ergothioneine biosynthesis glutamate--cysteine ligase EgtA [Acidimicrobiia bacterium]|nr:ergothioneine biosynthesis glutamate--cysteine ligase EgtA [Acidimicrobiia bacterium]